MTSLKRRITRYMGVIALITTIILLALTVVFQVRSEQANARANANDMFHQIGQVLTENHDELLEIQDEYSQIILRRADNIAYILQQNPDAFWDTDELTRIAQMVGVDEIHLFDIDGKIVSGTVPAYYGYTFDSGEQMAYFKPILADRSLRMVQDITPNTADSKLMQYSLIWSLDGEFLVQVGMEPVNVLKMTEKNELSYIFSLLRSNTGTQLYAADRTSGEIRGATEQADIGRTLDEVGISPADAKDRTQGFHTVVGGVPSYCVFTTLDDNLVGYVISHEALYANVPHNTVSMLIALVLVALLLVAAVTRCMEKYVIDSVSSTNASLREITEGDLEKHVDIRSSVEFSELSDHINAMVGSLLGSTKKMSDVINRSGINMGVYEYNARMRHVRCTERVPEILGLEPGTDGQIALEGDAFRRRLEQLLASPLPGEDRVYCLAAQRGTRYVKLEEIVENHETIGIVMDVTDEVVRRKEIETERDVDQLTGILNRRGLDNALADLFQCADKTEHSAVIMVDADGLKAINDTYGHDNGDIYIRAVADSLRQFGETCGTDYLVSRNGGDEFVLFLYGCGSDEDLLRSIQRLQSTQDQQSVVLNNGQTVCLRFSLGYTLRTPEMSYYGDLFKAADQHMYENKRARKGRA